MTSPEPFGFPFTTADTPELRQRVIGDLRCVRSILLDTFPGADLYLAGSFSFGEGVAKVYRDRLFALSDYDFYLVLSNPLLQAATAPRRARRVLETVRPQLHNPRVDLNIVFLPLVRLGLQGIRAKQCINAEREPPKTGLLNGGSFQQAALERLRESLFELLALAPPLSTPDLRWRRYCLNRCATGLVRAAHAWCATSDPTGPATASMAAIEQDSFPLQVADTPTLRSMLEENIELRLCPMDAREQPMDREDGDFTHQRWCFLRDIAVKLVAEMSGHVEPRQTYAQLMPLSERLKDSARHVFHSLEVRDPRALRRSPAIVLTATLMLLESIEFPNTIRTAETNAAHDLFMGQWARRDTEASWRHCARGILALRNANPFRLTLF